MVKWWRLRAGPAARWGTSTTLSMHLVELVGYAFMAVGVFFLRIYVVVIRIIYKGHQPHPLISEHMVRWTLTGQRNPGRLTSSPRPQLARSTLQPIPWYFYNSDESKWVPFRPSSDPESTAKLRVATFNVLSNDIAIIDSVTKTPLRFQFTAKTLLPDISADVFCLNEVNPYFCSVLLDQHWVKTEFVVSANETHLRRESAQLLFSHFSRLTLRISSTLRSYFM